MVNLRSRTSMFVFLLLLALLAGTGPWLPNAASQVTAAVAVDAEVRARIQSEGSARVLVELRTPRGAHIAEGDLRGGPAIAAQRRDIAAARAAVVARLAGSPHRIHREYNTVPYVALEVSDAALRALEASVFEVVRVVEDRLVPLHLATSGPLVQANQAWARGFDGTGATVAVLDTGVQSNHPFLNGKVVEEACFAGVCPNGQTSQIGPGAGQPCTDHPLCFHGTHVAGIAAGNGAGAGVGFSGVARGATVMSVQVFTNFSGFLGAAYSDLLAALDHVTGIHATHQFASVNMSLGGGLYTTFCDTDPLKTAIDNLRSYGIATVIAAGNDGQVNAISAPGCISSAVSVGATDNSDTVAVFSNVASFMSLFAPGQHINSSVTGGTFTTASGTSMAAPHVAGAWAILKQASATASVTQVLTALQQTGLSVSDTRSGGTVTRPRIRVANALEQFLVPGATISSPTNGATVSGTTTVNMSVAGAVSGSKTFRLYRDGNLVSTQTVSGTTASYSWNTRNIINGGHTLGLTVTDAAGHIFTSPAVIPNVSNAYIVAVTAPTNGANVTGTGWVTVWWEGAAVSAPTYTVSVDGQVVAQQAASAQQPTSIPWDTARAFNGTRTLTVSGTDGAGNVASSNVSINVSNPFAAKIWAPASGATVGGSTTIQMSAGGSPTVYNTFNLKVDGTNQIFNHATPSVGDTYDWSLLNWSNGSHTLLLTVTATNGASKSTSIPLTINNVIYPEITAILMPGGNWSMDMAVSGQTSTWGHTFNIKIDGQTVYNHYVPGISDHFDWNTAGWANGDHTVQFTISDGVGKSVGTTFILPVSH